jgi:chromosome partitioning protein
MTIIAFISQKGGVGKSTLARALAVEASHEKFHVLLADCDPQQATSYNWLKKRHKSKFEVKIFPTVQQALREASKYDLTIIDGPARTSHATLEVAQKADLVVQPTGASADELVPAAKEFNALVKAGINRKKLLFVLTRIGSQAEVKAVKEYLKNSEYSFGQTCLFEKVSYRQAQNEGKAITEVTYPGLVQQAKGLIKEILRYL